MKLSKILLTFTLLLLLISCSTTKRKLIPTANKGGYLLNLNTNLNLSEKNITGRVFDIKTNALLGGIELTVGCKKTQTNTNGEFSFKLKEFSNGALFIKASGIGYKIVETDFINMKNKNILNIDFYLAEDDRPFINCQ